MQVTIPLQSFSNKTKCITNINNCQELNRKPPVHTKSSSPPKSDESMKDISQAATTTATAKVKDGWSSDDSILKSIDEDNKSTSSTVSSSSAFEDSANMYSEKSESSMSSINLLNRKVNENGKSSNRSSDVKTVENGAHDEDDSLEVLSSYDNDSGNDEFDEKGDRFNQLSYSSSDSRSDKKLRNYFNSLPLMRAKKHNNAHSNFNSIRGKHFNNSAIDQEPFRDDTKAINLPSPSPSCGSWSSDSNMLQQNLSTTKSSSVPILVKKDQFLEDFNKLTVSDKKAAPTTLRASQQGDFLISFSFLRLYRFCGIRGLKAIVIYVVSWNIIFISIIKTLFKFHSMRAHFIFLSSRALYVDSKSRIVCVYIFIL